jgi:hypothetical protein
VNFPQYEQLAKTKLFQRGLKWVVRGQKTKISVTSRQQPETLIQPIWSSNRAFRVDRPFQKLTKFHLAILLN